MGDITLRAIETLRTSSYIAAEDTRVSSRLLAEHGIVKPMLSAREHNENAAAQRIVERLRAGEDVALITDAGTPGISDPGARVVRAVRAAGLSIAPIPGPAALIAALSCAGLEDGPWMFAGFLPAKPGARRKLLAGYASLPCALVFYEAPHRIRECVSDLVAMLGPERTLLIARELTKLFEQIVSMPLGDAPGWVDADANHARGEFVLIVSAPEQDTRDADVDGVLRALLDELPASQAARITASITGHKRAELYDRAMQLQARKP
jgi:16S rRNA (cytidine1402-2'-O)-methyltransferase